MSTPTATLEQVCNRLQRMLEARRDVSQWTFVAGESEQHQLFAISDTIECRRKGTTWNVLVRVFSDHPDGGGRGEASIVLDASTMDERSIAGVVEAAGLVKNPPYRLVEHECSGIGIPLLEEKELLPERELEQYVSSSVRRLNEECREACDSHGRAGITYFELFRNVIRKQFRSSWGAEVRWSETRYLLEAAAVAEGNGRAAESFRLLESRTLQGLALEEELRASLTEARDLLSASGPELTGKLPVVFRGAALENIMMPLVAHLGAEYLYRGTARYGDSDTIETIDGVPGFRLEFDNGRPWGLHSAPVDTEGIPSRRHVLLDRARIVSRWGTSQYAAYTGLEPTGTPMELALHPYEEARLGDDSLPLPRMEIHELSYMGPDPLTGDISSEIRCAYEIDERGRRAVKGGIVRGNLFSNLHTLRFSRRSRYAPGLLAPEWFLFEGMEIHG